MVQHLESKTVIGLLILLGCIVALALAGKLTSEAIEGLKWIGGSYMGVRGVANAFENLSGKRGPDAD